MDTIAVIAALISAVLHAGWNAAVKAAPEPAKRMTGQMVASALIVLPALFFTGLPAAASLPWLAASTIVNVFTVNALLKVYQLAGYGIGYPSVRSLSVVLVTIVSTVFGRTPMSGYGYCGVVLIVGALALLASGGSTSEDRSRRLSPDALLWIAIAGIGSALYVLCDSHGAPAAGNAIAYGCVVSVLNALSMLWMQRRIIPGWREAAHEAWTAWPIALAAAVSYTLILWVWSRSPVAPSAALRDTSSIFALIIAVLWLKEPFTRTRLAAIVLAALAIPLLRFA